MTQSSSLPAVLRERASLQPNDTAFTYLDYDQDQDGVADDVTWSQLYRRVRNVAHELRLVGSPGDRVVLLAPQGLDYIAAFLGALEAKRIAVPLSVPQVGAHDERVGSVLRDTSPSAILTTSPVAGGVADYAQPQHDSPAPQVIEVDGLASDTPKGSRGRADATPETAYLQYTSGSTREPAGVMVTNRNLSANFEQMYADFFSDCGKVAPPDTTVVSWLPFYHDMGLLLGVCVPILGGLRTVLTSPLAFLARPSRWMQLLASHSRTLTAAPNFAFELAVRKTSDDDLDGLDLGNVMGIISGSERVHTATLQRFTERFARFGFQEKAIRPSYGLAEATVYVATRDAGHPPEVVHFEPEKLSAGHAKRRSTDGGTSLVSYGTPQSPAVRIVDPDNNTERPAGEIGEIWVHGENVAAGYWNKPQETDDKFHAKLAAPSDGTAGEPWLRTGDLGFISDGELFIMGRIKDTLIVYGRNHYPEDIEATIQEISGGRVAAISIPDDSTEKLVAIIELNTKGCSDDEAAQRCDAVKRSVTSELSKLHGLSAADLVLVAPGAIPITTSGKIRRSTAVEQYRNDGFARLDG